MTGSTEGGGDGVIVLDLSRLLWRAPRAAPGGIDRVELALAEALLGSGRACRFAFSDGGRLRLFRDDAARALLRAASERWRGQADDIGASRVRAYLAGEEPFPPMRPRWRDGRLGAAELAGWAMAWLRHGHWSPPLPAAALAGATYVNVSHRNLDDPRLHRVLRGFGRRIAYVHDDIPLRAPALSLPALTRSGGAMLRLLAQEGFEWLTNSRSSARRLADHAAALGHAVAPVVIAPPLAAPFLAPVPTVATARRYFVAAGLFTRRKNLGLLGAAAALAAGQAGVAFDIICLGAPGRDAAAVLAGLPPLGGAVRLLRAEGLRDHAYRLLLAGSRGLLAASLDEGFDYPVQEALATGIAVLASDIEVHREFLAPATPLLPAEDAAAWAEAMRQAVTGGPASRPPPATADAAALLAHVVGGKAAGWHQRHDRAISQRMP